MLLLDQEVIVKWNCSNRKHFESKGYQFTNYGDEFKVNVLDLKKRSNIEVKIKCDYCENIFFRVYADYTRRKEKQIISKDACQDCVELKRKDTFLIKYGETSYPKTDEFKIKVKNTVKVRYGVESVAQLIEVKEKTRQTNLKKYGKEYFSQTDEWREKCIETSLKKYGAEHPMKNNDIKNNLWNKIEEKFGTRNLFAIDEIREKAIKTNLKKYGTLYSSQSELVKEKVKKTNKERYGYDYSLQNEEIRSKIKQTLYKNNNAKTSKQQLYIHKLIGGELNFPVGRYNLDIAFPKEKIYIEYDGGGHKLCVKMGFVTEEEFIKNERKRDFFLKDRGWKRIRIISKNDLLPSDEIILNEINKAKMHFKTGGRHYDIVIDINNNKFGKLRRIKEEDLNDKACP